MGRVFVFGSNKAGRHGKGAALHALQHCGAIRGIGEGLMGSSYAIPTKDSQLRTLPLEEVQRGVENFLWFAKSHQNLTFDVTPIGCGLAGYKRSQIEPMFADMPPNCHFTPSWDEHHD